MNTEHPLAIHLRSLAVEQGCLMNTYSIDASASELIDKLPVVYKNITDSSSCAGIYYEIVYEVTIKGINRYFKINTKDERLTAGLKEYYPWEVLKEVYPKKVEITVYE